MDVVGRSRIVASATWRRGTQSATGGTASRRSFDRSVASFGTVPHPRIGRGCDGARTDRRLASADRRARQAGTSPRRFSGPVGNCMRGWSNASPSQPSRNFGTCRRPARPCLLTFKSNYVADIQIELRKCVSPVTRGRPRRFGTVHRVSTKITPSFHKDATHALHCCANFQIRRRTSNSPDSEKTNLRELTQNTQQNQGELATRLNAGTSMHRICICPLLPFTVAVHPSPEEWPQRYWPRVPIEYE